MTAYPDDYLACSDTCGAAAGERCYTLRAVGPEALSPRYADRPHSSRAVRGAVRTPSARRTVKSATPVPVRRAAARTNSTVVAWQARAKKETT